jgi:hypothetical protein
LCLADADDLLRHATHHHPCPVLPGANNNGTVASVEGLAAPPFANTGAAVMRKTLLVVGFLALAIGLLWIGQGTGVVAWPASSFMIRQIQWAGYGAALAAVGLILIWQAQR